MDWLSFTLGFFAFPLAVGVTLVLYLGGRKFLASEQTVTPRAATLSFSSRLIGEIGEDLEVERSPTAKAS